MFYFFGNYPIFLIKSNYYYTNKKFFFRVSELLDYTADDLTGQSLYALCHGEDVHKMRKTHEDRKHHFVI